MYKNYLKRVIDFLFALVGLVILSPVLLIVSIGLIIVNRGNPFFLQERPGKNEKIFKIVKFKTMNDKKDSSGNLLPDPERLTSLGGFVRKASLDEIPQLINVLKGDMSLIGPRPLRVYYLPLYSETQKKRHDVRPGITGWAQVNGRNAISWTKKFEYDVWYVNNITLKTDIKILLLTLKKVIKSEGIYQGAEPKVERFNGHN